MKDDLCPKQRRRWQRIQRVSIVGAGRVGSTLANLLNRGGWRLAAVVARTLSSARAATAHAGGGLPSVRIADAGDAEWALIAVPDDALPPVAEALARGERVPRVALHTSGALGSEVLQSLRARGVACGSLHPVHTFASREEPVAALQGVFGVIEGDDPAKAAAHAITSAWGGEALEIAPEAKALYHAAAVVASNYLSAVCFVAERLGAESGLGDQACRVFVPLLRATLERAGTLGLPTALTGPIERGDQATVVRHLTALRARGAADRDAVLALYAGCGLVAARMAALKRAPVEGEAGATGAATGATGGAAGVPEAARLPEPWRSIAVRLSEEFEVSR